MKLSTDIPLFDWRKVPRPALWLGLSGVIPFAACGLLSLIMGEQPEFRASADLALLAYGAVILSFLGGVRWGLALNEEDENTQGLTLALSTVPSLIGWLALLFPFMGGLVLLIFAHISQGIWDVFDMSKGKGPAWYGTLRVILSSSVVVVLVIVFAGRAFTG